jgi:hypothetical protein
MYVLHSKQYFNKVKFSNFFRKPFKSVQMKKYFSTSTYIHHKIQFFFGLKGPMQFYNKGMIHLFQNASLTKNRFYLIFHYYFAFFNYFHSIESARILFPTQQNFRKSSSAYYFDQLKVANHYLFFLV